MPIVFGPAVAGAAIGAASKVGGALLGHKWNKQSSSKAFARQVWMASHAHQLEVKDLRSAGLNPILSAGGGGASFPGAPQTNSTDVDSELNLLQAAAVKSQVNLQNAQAQAARDTVQLQQAQADAQIRASNAQTASLSLKNKSAEAMQGLMFEIGKDGKPTNKFTDFGKAANLVELSGGNINAGTLAMVMGYLSDKSKVRLKFPPDPNHPKSFENLKYALDDDMRRQLDEFETKTAGRRGFWHRIGGRDVFFEEESDGVYRYNGHKWKRSWEEYPTYDRVNGLGKSGRWTFHRIKD